MQMETTTMSRAPQRHTDIKELPFEQALRELEGIVGRLERGDVALEESIVIYERGEALDSRCQASA